MGALNREILPYERQILKVANMEENQDPDYFIDWFGFSRKLYPCVQSLYDKFRDNMTARDISLKYGIDYEKVDTLINEASNILNKYKILLEKGYVYCYENNLLSPELKQLGLSDEVIAKLSKEEIYTPKQLIESKNLPITDDELSFILNKIDDSKSIDNPAIVVKEVSKEKSISDLVMKTIKPYIDIEINLQQYREIFSVLHGIMNFDPIPENIKKIRKDSNRILIAKTKYKLYSVPGKTGIYIITDKETYEEVIMGSRTKKMKSNEIYIANNRERYPYGILYGSFGPKEQNRFPRDYVKNTDDLVEYLAKTNTAVAIVRDVQKNKMTYKQIREKYPEYADMDSEKFESCKVATYDAVKKNSNMIFSGVKVQQNTTDDESWKKYGVIGLTLKVINSVGITVEMVDSCVGLSQLRALFKKSNLSEANQNTAITDMLEKLNANGYDTTRFGYLGTKSEDNLLTSDEFMDKVEVETAKVETKTNSFSVTNESRAAAYEYAKSIIGTEMTEEEFNQFRIRFSQLWRNTNSTKALSATSIGIYLNNEGMSTKKIGPNKYSIIYRNSIPSEKNTKTVSIPVVKEERSLPVEAEFRPAVNNRMTAEKILEGMSKEDLINMIMNVPAVEPSNCKILSVTCNIKYTCPKCGKEHVDTVRVSNDGYIINKLCDCGQMIKSRYNIILEVKKDLI